MTQHDEWLGDSRVTQQDGAAYTITRSDKGAILYFTNDSAVTVTVQAGLGQGFEAHGWTIRP